MLQARQSDWLRIVCVSEDDHVSSRFEIADAQVLWHVLEPVTAADIAAAPQLKLIQKIGVGVNTIDLDAARQRGIAVANMPGTNSQAVAEHTLLLMLACLRRAIPLDSATRAGRGWQVDRRVFDRVGEIRGRTIGFVGFGAVPQRLAPVCSALGARIVYTATAAKPGLPWEHLTLGELLAKSDIVSLHVPLTPVTQRLINADALSKMKSGAILINTARGALVDEQALLEALRNGRLIAAGLDVFAQEPLPDAHPLYELDNVVLAPHVAWLTPETLTRSLDVAVDNCRRLRDGDTLRHRVI